MQVATAYIVLSRSCLPHRAFVTHETVLKQICSLKKMEVLSPQHLAMITPLAGMCL